MAYFISTMLAAWCLLLLLFQLIHGQLDNLGFISIDCGLPGNSSYTDKITKISYTSDTQYTNTGTNYNISAKYITPSISMQYWSLRSFPSDTRSCYTLRSLTKGLKYLVRATFLYGNYDGLDKLVLFDLYIGVNFWRTVNISDAASTIVAEIITVIQDDYVQVCMVNTGMGIPFISGLELRAMNKNEVYPFVNVTQAVDLHRRLNVGPTDNGLLIRYPDDPYDRIWEPWSNVPYWAEISTSSAIQGADNDLFEVPSVVMQTAIQPVDSTDIKFYWAPKPQDKDPKYIAVMHFAELQKLKRKDLRQFEVYLNGIPWYDQAINPRYLYRDTVYNSNPKRGYLQYNILVSATSNSTLPPIINAMEIFMVLQTAELATDSEDVIAINAIKRSYQVKKNWIGDPCAPKIYAWESVNCSYAFSNPPRITTLNLSSNGLVGSISTAFANLTAIQYLDLSHNNLTGSMPDVLGQLPSLIFLDLTNNQLNGSIPANLLKKSQDGSLTLRVGDNLNLCANGTSCELPPNKKSSAISAVIIVPVIVLVLLLVVIFVLCRMRKWRALAANTSVRPQSEYNLKRRKDYADNSLQLENRQFTYKELEVITEKFQRVLGEGGFGAVYDGFLEDGTQVAVKILSQSSSQGFKEFLAEAQHLARVHHRNLVSMIGYCNDGDNLALVYEFMSEGTLQDHLRGRSERARPLTWRQRLHIALESAQGLEYLHKGCKPPLIHRDVKTNNILLNAKLEAKIADFGLSKAFNSDINTHVSTAVVGTPGYLDPEYYSTFQISEKSDVYSFGVVLLEVITGQPSILPGAERVHVIHWVRQRLAKGFIETIVDERMEGKCNVNSVWKVADIALKCTAQSSNERPTMTDVVMQLKECLELEDAGQRSDNLYSGSSNLNPRSDNIYPEPSEISQNSAFEMEHMAMLMALQRDENDLFFPLSWCSCSIRLFFHS